MSQGPYFRRNFIIMLPPFAIILHAKPNPLALRLLPAIRCARSPFTSPSYCVHLVFLNCGPGSQQTAAATQVFRVRNLDPNPTFLTL